MNNFAYDVFIILFCSCAVFTILNKGDVNEDDRKHECIHSCIKFLLFIAKIYKFLYYIKYSAL